MLITISKELLSYKTDADISIHNLLYQAVIKTFTSKRYI